MNKQGVNKPTYEQTNTNSGEHITSLAETNAGMSNYKMEEQRTQLNIILLGKTGSGKSASGNTFLQNKTFRSALRAKATTQDITKGNVTIDGTHITVYDTPGLFDTERSDEEILAQWRNDLPLDQSAPTVFLLVIRPERFTDEQTNTVKLVEMFLGERRLKNTWILFTRGDELEHDEMTIEEFIEETEDIKTVVERFGDRYHVFNNREENLHQVKDLLRKIRGPSPPPPAQTGALPERRLVLLGMTGAGKSASGNTILREERFHSEQKFDSVTRNLKVEQAIVEGRNVSVVDTPGLFDTGLPEAEVLAALASSIYECSPGPHAFLIVVSLTGRFTEQDKRVIDLIKLIYGEDALKYAIILFTYGDQLDTKANRTVQKCIEENKALSDLVNQCGGRYHVFQNRDLRNQRQATELLEKIDVMVAKNGGSYYRNAAFEVAVACRERAERACAKQISQEEKQKQNEMLYKDMISLMMLVQSKFDHQRPGKGCMQLMSEESQSRDSPEPGLLAFLSFWFKKFIDKMKSCKQNLARYFSSG